MEFLMNINLNKNELQNAVIQPLATAPADPVLGQIYYNSAEKALYQFSGTEWARVGVVYENASDNGKVITGLAEDGTVTTVDVKDLKVKGITPVEGGYVADNMTLAEAVAALDTAVKNAVAGGGEVNQNAYSAFKVGETTVTATMKTDTFEVAGGDNVTVTADEATKKITISATVPSKTSQLTNDSNFVSDENYVHTDNNYTAEDKQKLANIPMNAEANVQVDWNETDTTSDAFIKNKPTKVSDFENDSAFVDNTVSDLVNYYLKTETYSQKEINTKIAAIATIKIQIVDTLPENGASNIFYLVSNGGASGNSYDEYVWTGTAFEKVGSTDIDLSNYVQKDGTLDTNTVAFTTATKRNNITSGDTLAVIMGKIAKYFGDLGDLAFADSVTSDALPTGTVVDKGYVKLRAASGSIPAGSTVASVTFTGTVYSVETYDATTNEKVLCDVSVTAGGVQVSISAAHTNVINIRVIYLAQ